MTSQRTWPDCCSLYAVMSSVIYYSIHVRENVIYLFYTLKIKMVYSFNNLIFGAWKKKITSADVICRGLTPSVCVSFNRSRSTTNENAHRSHVIVLTIISVYIGLRSLKGNIRFLRIERCSLTRLKHLLFSACTRWSSMAMHACSSIRQSRD